MKTDSLEVNPYQVKSRRFQRSTIECEMKQQASMEKVKSLISIRSPFHPKQFTSQHNNNIKHTNSIDKNKGMDIFCQGNTNRLNSVEKSKLKRKQSFKNQQNNFQQREAFYIRLLNEKQKRIESLTLYIKQKQIQNLNLQQKLRSYDSMRAQKQRIQQKYKQQFDKLQNSHNEQAYKLKQNIKKLQIDVSCINRKWSFDYEKMLKEKQQQIKILREKYTSILKSKRLKSQKSITSLFPSAFNGLQIEKNLQTDLLDLSSFQLSKQQHNNQQLE